LATLPPAAAWASEQYKQAALLLRRQATAGLGNKPQVNPHPDLSSLSLEAQLVLALRHGWLGDKLTYAQIGKRMNASGELPGS
jgi:hypothetical protein